MHSVGAHVISRIDPTKVSNSGVNWVPSYGARNVQSKERGWEASLRASQEEMPQQEEPLPGVRAGFVYRGARGFISRWLALTVQVGTYMCQALTFITLFGPHHNHVKHGT